MISWWLPYLAKGPTLDFNNGPGNGFNVDLSKQHYCGVISLDMLTSLGQPTIRLRRYGCNTSKERSLRRKNKNKVEEIQLANLAGQEPRKQKSSR